MITFLMWILVMGKCENLGFNNTENPFSVAQEFLWKEGLDQGFLDTVAQFIVKNAKTVTLGDSSPVAFKDPFTGGNRYVPGSQDSMEYNYTSPQKQLPKHYPQKAPLLFETVNYNAILSKITEFNTQVIKTQQSAALNSDEIELLNSIVKVLSETSRYHVSSFSQVQFQLIFSKLLQWPTSNLFPKSFGFNTHDCTSPFRSFQIYNRRKRHSS